MAFRRGGEVGRVEIGNNFFKHKNHLSMKRLALLLLISTTTLPSFSFAQVREKKATPFNAAARPKNLSDSVLLDQVQKQTFRYFWDFAHPVSGLARERSNMGNDYGPETTTTGGTGFGIM